VERKNMINGFVQLGELFRALGKEEPWNGFELGVTSDEYASLQDLINRQFYLNGWYVKENVLQAILALGEQLTEEKMTMWLHNYAYASHPKRVAIIMAGNIPLVGFHDFLCVLLSGNTAVCKLSNDDKTLLPAFATVLYTYLPELQERIVFTTGKIGEVDAVIATGSDNTLKYFEQYFGKYPHIFRKNRTSVAVITGKESAADFHALGYDIFSYFGLGCRNVSHLLFPRNFELSRFFEGILAHSSVINHNKYGNNYDYNKAIFLLNQHALFDNNFVLLRESEDLFSPLAMVHYHFYDNQEDISSYLQINADKIQVVVGDSYVPFGAAQCPMLSDYADGIDTMLFLNQLTLIENH
jgi:hypothetical protein